MTELVRACPVETWAAILRLREVRAPATREELAEMLSETMPDLKLANAVAFFLLDWGLEDIAVYEDWLPHATCCERHLATGSFSGLRHFARLIRSICDVYRTPPGPPYITKKLGTRPVVYLAKRTPAANTWLRIITVSAALLALLQSLMEDERKAIAETIQSRRRHIEMNGFCLYPPLCARNEALAAFCTEVDAGSERFIEFVLDYSTSHSNKVGYVESAGDYIQLVNLRDALQSWMMRCCHVRKVSV